MSLLFTPFTIRSLSIRNRLWVSPMCQYSAGADGVPTEWHHTHLAQFASGGAGAVFTEAAAVSAEGRISPEDVGIWNDAQQEAWTPIVAAIHQRGAIAGIQLAHAGRKGSTWSPFGGEHGTVPASRGGWQPVAPSATAYGTYAQPAALDVSDIDKVVSDFAAAATRAVAAGFDILEIHAAHGYLVHEFLSPLSNLRTDQYGGSLHNRARLLLEIVDAVRLAHPDVPLFVRFSATDWAKGGWSVEDTSTVAAWAAEHGADFFDISSGGLTSAQKITVGPGYQVPFAADVRAATGAPVSAVGEITTGAQAEAILAAGHADAIMAAREWLRDPHFALRADTELANAAGTESDATLWPPQYVRARRG